MAGEDDAEGEENQHERGERHEDEQPAIHLQVHVVEGDEQRLDRRKPQDDEDDPGFGDGQLSQPDADEHEPGEPTPNRQVRPRR